VSAQQQQTEQGLPPGFLASLSRPARSAFVRTIRRVRPSERLSLIQWAERHRYVATGSRSGPFRADAVPVLRGILEAVDDPSVREIVFKKPSQIGWTVTVVLNVIGYLVASAPCAIIALFAKDGAAKRFVREKLDPTIRSTPALMERIPVDKRNDPSNTTDFKGFPGGFLMLAGANSPANVKSTDARVVLVEEPDDVAHDVKGQGDAISLAKARSKTFPDRIILIGGTPTIEDHSAVSAEMGISDQRRFVVACPHCGHVQRLVWEQVEWLSDADTTHAVYGRHRPETARYKCAADDCGALWSDYEKNEAVRQADKDPNLGWQATAAFTGVAGFDLEGGGELYSTLSESRMEVLARRYLEAKHRESEGDTQKLVEFWNGTLARTWKLKADTPEVEVLVDRVEQYPAWTCPEGGLILVGSVDVQRGGENSEPRLEYQLKAFGRGMESWRVAYGAVPGNPLEQATWDALDHELAREVRNAGGGVMPLRGMSIDASDGMTSDAVYAYCRRNRHRGFVAVKGANEQGRRQREIFTPPSPLDHTATDKAAKWGLKLYIVGTRTAKDQIYARLKLTGSGPGRMHFDADTDSAYMKGLTSEAKMPKANGVAYYVKKAGVPNEPLDLEVMCLHQAHRLRLHTWDDRQWDQAEREMRQPDLLNPQRSATPQQRNDDDTAPAVESTGRAQKFRGYRD
jgi:phage terminase large subunit GpA-like protein